MRKELHVSHIPQPPKPVTIPLSSKKKTKKKQKKTRKKQKQKTKTKKQKKTKKTKKQKKPKKKPKTRTTHAHFFRLPHGSERSKRDIYIFIRTHPFLGCQGDSDDVIGSKINTPN